MSTSVDARLESGRSPDLSRLVATAAREHPATPLFADDGWPEQPGPVRDVASFHAAVEHLAGRLWAAGVRPRQVVAVVLPNHPRVQLAAFALHRLGAVPALLAASMPAEHLVESVAALHPAWTLVDSGEDAPGYAADNTPQGSAPEPAPGVLDLLGAHTRLLRRADLPAPAAFPVGALNPHEVALITHTSGTTAAPKLVAHSSASIHEHAAPQVRLMLEFGADRLAVKAISCVHARATSALITALVVGQPLAFATDDRPEAVAALLALLRPHSLEAHPNTYLRWEPIADLPDRPLASVARFSSTFDAIHPRTVRRLLSGTDVPDAFFLQAYGQTETGPVAARAMTREDPLGHDTRVVGVPAEGREARVVDEAGEPVPVGVAGHIEVRAVSRMVGYVGRESPGVEWWPMGDWGRLRADGAIELLDRVVDRVPGVASTLALEDALLDRFPELQEALVLPGARRGVRVVVVARPGASADRALVGEAVEELGATPEEVVALAPEDLPVTGSKKVRRHVLRGAVGGAR